MVRLQELRRFHIRIQDSGESRRRGAAHKLFRDRNQHEILAFMPGERLVEEFLHEFFDIIRRDIDATLFRRMYGRKLKDPNVPSLRRRPWQYSDSEEEINRRGRKINSPAPEESVWHRIAKVGFVGRGP